MRDALDRYDTPAWCVDRLLEAIALPVGFWLEPSCGSGSIVEAVVANPGYVYREGATWTLLDLEPRGKMVVRAEAADFLTWKAPERRRYRVAIGNPPYRHAFGFVRRCHELADVTVMLLRLSFLASSTRARWLRRHPPDVYVLPNRPSFTGGGTDSTDYGWFAWGLSAGGRLHVLAETPREVRKMARVPEAELEPDPFADVPALADLGGA